MTRDDIISMVKEASGGRQPDGWGVMLDHEQLERFAELIAAAEREAIAEMVSNCDSRATPKGIAAAIRVRGQHD